MKDSAFTHTFQYYCVLQSLHKHVPVLLCTPNLGQIVPSTTVYYKACTNTFPVLLCTTKLAQTRPSTTVYYKACTNTFRYYCILQSLQGAPFRTLMRVHVHKGCACQNQISHALLRDSSWITALCFPKPAWRALTTTRTSRRRHGARPGTDLGQQSSSREKEKVCATKPGCLSVVAMQW